MNIFNINNFSRIYCKNNLFFPQFLKFKIFGFKFWSNYYTQCPEYNNDWFNGDFPVAFYSKDYSIGYCKRQEKYSISSEINKSIKKFRKFINNHFSIYAPVYLSIFILFSTFYYLG